MDVIGIENPIMDILIQLEKLPLSDGAVSLDKLSWQGGGNVSSAIVAAARLGATSGMIGIVGNDPFGNFCINDFWRHGIDVSHILTDSNGETPLCICLAETSTKMRSFIGARRHCRRLSVSDLDKEYIKSAKYIHIGRMNETTIQAAKWAKENGVKVVTDAGYYDPETERYLELIDIFIASEFYYMGLFNDLNYYKNCKAIQSRGPEIVVITLGSKGCVGVQNDEYFEVPAFANVEIVDTTGAGDVFHGAFIYGLLQGWSAKETARFSNAVSAIKCTRLGGRAGIPDREMVDRFLKDGCADFSPLEERENFYKNALFDLGQKCD